MPNFDCQCQKCKNVFELTIPIPSIDIFDKQEHKEIRCPKCQGELKRLLGTPRIKTK
jgi:predicted nucleic acid-binding Zn ribbon protein